MIKARFRTIIYNDQEDKGEYANRQFFYEPKLSGKYKARMLTTDGVTVYSCPIDEGDDIAKSQKQPVKTYPNPAVEGAEFVIEILDYNPETDYTIIISNNNSVIVNEIHDAEQISPLSMPRGVYSGALISGGKKRGFKLMVK